MDAPLLAAGARADARNLPLVRRGNPDIVAASKAGFPKSARILRSKDFRRIYDGGSRISSSLFSAFVLRESHEEGPRIGFTTPRALGTAVVRNRLRRRFREAVRARLDLVDSQWSVVINPRRKALDCSFGEIEREIERLFRRCNEL